MIFETEHKWRREPSFWDDLAVPNDVKSNETFVWLAEVCPDPTEHDYVLYTDGSGDIHGWGASASIIDFIDVDTETGYRKPAERMVKFSATYGSTVQRREFTAMLDGLYGILTHALERWHENQMSEEERYDGRLTKLTGNERISVLWYTDRANLAKSLLFNERSEPLNARSAERDLWLRFSAMAKHFCITPMHMDRNVVPDQERCDAICTAARLTLKDGMLKSLAGLMPGIPLDSWTKPIPQKALF